MELKVWVEGIQRIVCGVTVNTTCQDVVFALAHATGKVGRFTLIERWRNNERLLAPNENPLKLLIKWGEYANDVQFILQRSENKQQQLQPQQEQSQRTEVAGGNNINSMTTDVSQNSPIANSVMLKKPLGLSNNFNSNNTNNFNNHINNNNINKINNIEHSTSSNVQQQHSGELLNYNATYDDAKELTKTFGSHEARQNENIGIVKGIPQRVKLSPTSTSSSPPPLPAAAAIASSRSSSVNTNNSNSSNCSSILHNAQQSSPVSQLLIPKHEKSHSNPIDMGNTHMQLLGTSSINGTGVSYVEHNSRSNNNNIYNQLGAHNSKSINEINLAVVRNSLDRRTAKTTSSTPNESTEIMFTSHNMNNNNNNNINVSNSSNSSNENLLDIYNDNVTTELYKNTPIISAKGALVPPPYRNPPPPRNSPLQIQQQLVFGQNLSTNPFLNDYGNQQDYDFEYQNTNNNNVNDTTNANGAIANIEESESIFQATQYNDLLQLIKFQREKISAQQMELTKYDAEIVYLENKERDQAQELEAISREITKADQIFRHGSEQLQTLQYVEEENELVKQQEKTLKSEIALLRSKLANCETELLQCKNKIRILMDDIEVEQRAISNKQKTNRQNVERDFLMEMERIQSEIDQAIHNTDTSNKTAENLKKEILLIENAIAEKKRQVEQLVNEMKEVNLQSLTVTTSEEIKHLLEGSNKPGSSRRIIGSPRQLENAVPTSKNPHGVWV